MELDVWIVVSKARLPGHLNAGFFLLSCDWHCTYSNVSKYVCEKFNYLHSLAKCALHYKATYDSHIDLSGKKKKKKP